VGNQYRINTPQQLGQGGLVVTTTIKINIRITFRMLPGDAFFTSSIVLVVLMINAQLLPRYISKIIVRYPRSGYAGTRGALRTTLPSTDDALRSSVGEWMCSIGDGVLLNDVDIADEGRFS
jgi:hypothetical protein